MEHPLNIWSTVTFVPCNILTLVHNIHRFYVHIPPPRVDVMSLVISGPLSAIWIVTFCPHFPVVLWVALPQLTWNYLDLSSVTFWLINNQTHVHNVHHVYILMEEILLKGGDVVTSDTTVSPTCVRQIGTLQYASWKLSPLWNSSF
jgi:hypothetical protein